MLIALLLTALVGLSIVAQGSVNAQLLRTSNLWLVLTIGNVVCLAGTLGMFLATRGRGGVLEELSRVPPRVLIPSLCGLAITAGMPLAIGRIGVFTSVTVVIAVQTLAGLLWDHLSTGAALSMARVAGAALVFAGAVLVTRG
jgi:uncharacterized membrane protein YdcZ (DUF606 family)